MGSDAVEPRVWGSISGTELMAIENETKPTRNGSHFWWYCDYPRPGVGCGEISTSGNTGLLESCGSFCGRGRCREAFMRDEAVVQRGHESEMHSGPGLRSSPDAEIVFK